MAQQTICHGEYSMQFWKECVFCSCCVCLLLHHDLTQQQGTSFPSAQHDCHKYSFTSKILIKRSRVVYHNFCNHFLCVIYIASSSSPFSPLTLCSFILSTHSLLVQKKKHFVHIQNYFLWQNSRLCESIRDNLRFFAAD